MQNTRIYVWGNEEIRRSKCVVKCKILILLWKVWYLYGIDPVAAKITIQDIAPAKSLTLTGWNFLEDGFRHKVLKALCIEGRPVYRYGILQEEEGKSLNTTPHYTDHRRTLTPS